MNYTINLFANVIQYRNIRDVTDDRWASDDDPISRYDARAIKDIQAYIQQNRISFSADSPIDVDIQGFIESTISDLQDTDVNWDEDHDLKALEIIASAITGNAALRDAYLAHNKHFTPIFSDKALSADVINSYQQEFDHDAMGLMAVAEKEQSVDRGSRQIHPVGDAMITLGTLEAQLANAIAIQSKVPEFQREYLQPAIDTIRGKIALHKKSNGLAD
jgi:hypothetical protein